MKRIGNLYNKVISVENLREADEKARKGKTNTYGVKVHDKNREANILALHEALLTKTFKTSPYDVFTIFEPKERLIFRLPYYPDRIVHHAVMNVLEPIWVRTFTHNTFSCVKGRGIEGLPIGNYLSQYLANLFLCYFMHRVNEVLKLDAAEYADDITFFSSSKEQLREAFKEIRKMIEDELKLKIKGNYQIFPIAANRYDKHGRALDYVGYKFYRNQKLIRKSIKKNFCHTVSRLNRRTPLLDAKAYKQAVAPWLGWAKHSDSKHLLKTIIKPCYYDSIL